MLGHPRHDQPRPATSRRRDAVALAASRRDDRPSGFTKHGAARIKTIVCAIVALLIGWWMTTVVLTNPMDWAGSLP